MDDNINININPDDLQDLSCDTCEGRLFSTSFLVKKLSALQSPTGQQMILPVQIFRCDNCGGILDPEA